MSGKAIIVKCPCGLSKIYKGRKTSQFTITYRTESTITLRCINCHRILIIELEK